MKDSIKVGDLIRWGDSYGILTELAYPDASLPLPFWKGNDDQFKELMDSYCARKSGYLRVLWSYVDMDPWVEPEIAMGARVMQELWAECETEYAEYEQTSAGKHYTIPIYEGVLAAGHETQCGLGGKGVIKGWEKMP